MLRKLATITFVLQLAMLSGCQINIDTKPETKTALSTSAGDNEIAALKAEIDSLKKTNSEKVQELESEVQNLKTQGMNGQRAIPIDKFQEARAIAEKYVLQGTKIKNKSTVSFKPLTIDQQKAGIFADYSNGDHISGYFAFDVSGQYTAKKNLDSWREDCDDLYAGDLKTSKSKHITIQQGLCLSRNKKHFPLLIRLIETTSGESRAVMLLVETVVFKLGNDLVLNAFVEANQNARLLKSY